MSCDDYPNEILVVGFSCSKGRFTKRYQQHFLGVYITTTTRPVMMCTSVRWCEYIGIIDLYQPVCYRNDDLASTE
jgi:hypothetical protein